MITTKSVQQAVVQGIFHFHWPSFILVSSKLDPERKGKRENLLLTLI